MSLVDAFPIAPEYINKYVWASLQQLDPSLTSGYQNIVPFFPVSDTRADEWPWQTRPYVIYDQLFRLRGKPLYLAKRQQLVYFIKGTPTEVLAWSNAIEMVLDRQDAAGQDVNAWIAQNDPDAGIFFHWFRTLQVDAVHENRTDMSTNQKYLSTLIVEFEYHVNKTNGFD